MLNHLAKPRNAILVSVGLAMIFLWAFAAKSTGFDDSRFWQVVLRWLHTGFSVAWIGLLLQLNLAAQSDAGGSAGERLTFDVFRWSMVASLGAGLLLALNNRYLLEVLSLGAVNRFINPRDALLGLGIWIALGMAASVWFMIWPDERVVSGEVTTDSVGIEAARHRRLLVLRINLILAVPMLVAMTASQTLFGR
jgi:uncharacterized membrane protein